MHHCLNRVISVRMLLQYSLHLIGGCMQGIIDSPFKEYVILFLFSLLENNISYNNYIITIFSHPSCKRIRAAAGGPQQKFSNKTG